MEITSNAASNTGASTAQNPSHIAFSTSVMSLKSKPRAFSLSIPGKGLELRFDTVPDRDDLVAEFLVVLPEIDKGSYQDSDHADHSQHRPDTPPRATSSALNTPPAFFTVL